MSTTSATAIQVNDRFFYGKSKTGRMQSAWSLAGAKLYRPTHDKEIKADELFLHQKGYKTKKVVVRVISDSNVEFDSIPAIEKNIN